MISLNKKSLMHAANVLFNSDDEDIHFGLGDWMFTENLGGYDVILSNSSMKHLVEKGLLPYGSKSDVIGALYYSLATDFNSIDLEEYCKDSYKNKTNALTDASFDFFVNYFAGDITAADYEKHGLGSPEMMDVDLDFEPHDFYNALNFHTYCVDLKADEINIKHTIGYICSLISGNYSAENQHKSEELLKLYDCYLNGKIIFK